MRRGEKVRGTRGGIAIQAGIVAVAILLAVDVGFRSQAADPPMRWALLSLSVVLAIVACIAAAIAATIRIARGIPADASLSQMARAGPEDLGERGAPGGDAAPSAEESARLRASEAKYRGLVEGARDLIYTVDLDGVFTYANRAFETLIGIPPEEILGTSLFDLLLDPADARSALQRAIVGERDQQVSSPLRTKDGRILHAMTTMVPAADADGVIRGVRCVTKDVTALHMILLEAERADRQKTEFLASMSHEIRTPLNAIIGFAKLLLEEPIDPLYKDWVGTICASGETLLHLINEIIDLSKIESGRLRLESIPFELRPFVRESVWMHLPRAKEKGIELLWEVSPDVPEWIESDPTRVRQMLTNLLSNAVKFTEKGSVTVRAFAQAAHGRRKGPRLVIEVRDQGIGIPKEKLDLIFQPFAQADGATTRKYGGTGLGLAITRELARALGGEIHVESEVGVGSSFRISLPLRAATPPRAAEETPAEGASAKAAAS